MSTALAITAGIALFTLIGTVAFAYQVVRLFKRLKDVNVMLQGQVTALGTIITHVINALDDTPREVVSNAFKTALGRRVSLNPPDLSDEDRNTFNQAFSTQLLAIIEKIKSPIIEEIKSKQSQIATQTPGT